MNTFSVPVSFAGNKKPSIVGDDEAQREGWVEDTWGEHSWLAFQQGASPSYLLGHPYRYCSQLLAH